jgi:hypothetical protein
LKCLKNKISQNWDPIRRSGLFDVSPSAMNFCRHAEI